MKLTKIDVAEAHLITAVRAHFRCEHQLPSIIGCIRTRNSLPLVKKLEGELCFVALPKPLALRSRS